MCVCVCVFVHVCTCISVCVCAFMYLYFCVCLSIHLYPFSLPTKQQKHQKDEVMAEYDTLIDPPPVLVPDTSAVQEEVSNTLQVEAEIEVVPSDDCDSGSTPPKDEIVPQNPAKVQDKVPSIIKVNIETEFKVCFPLEERSTVITITPMETLKGTSLITYTLSFHTRKVRKQGLMYRFITVYD